MIITSLKQIGLEIKEPPNKEKRFTCLGQPFHIKEYVSFEFMYCGRKWKESFNILPGRSDKTILLGRSWIIKMSNGKDSIEKIDKRDSQEQLKGKLFTRSPNGVKIKYECPINCSEDGRITEGTPMIPQSMEDKMNTKLKIY